MGYYASITQSTLRLPNENEREAYRLMCELNKRDDLKTGGSWSGGVQTEKWFSWMPSDYPDKCETAADILNELGFGSYHEDDYLAIESYDSKIGAEELFLAEICHLLEGELYWHGEDGETWAWRYGGLEPVAGKTSITWEDE